MSRLLSLDEIDREFKKAKLELLAILREMHGTILRISNHERYDKELRDLARNTALGVMSEIHELKIELEHDSLGEIPF